MLFPVKHENMTARRWPVVTLGLILLNFLIFLATHQTMEKQEDFLWSVKMHVLVLAAQHPDLAISPKAQQFVADFQAYDPTDWAEMQGSSFKPIDDWDEGRAVVFADFVVALRVAQGDGGEISEHVLAQ